MKERAGKESLYGEDSYDEQITNIHIRLAKGTKLYKRHGKDSMLTPREVPLIERQKARLWHNLAILLVKKRYGRKAGVDLDRMLRDAQKEYNETGNEEARFRIDALTRAFRPRQSS